MRKKDVIRIVRNEDDRSFAAFVQLFDQIHNVIGRFGIQIAGRLVRQNNPRIIDECSGNGHSLLLSAGKLGGKVIGESGKPHFFQKRHGSF